MNFSLSLSLSRAINLGCVDFVVQILEPHVHLSIFMLIFEGSQFSRCGTACFSEGIHLGPVPQPPATVAIQDTEDLSSDKVGTRTFYQISLIKQYPPPACHNSFYCIQLCTCNPSPDFQLLGHKTDKKKHRSRSALELKEVLVCPALDCLPAVR